MTDDHVCATDRTTTDLLPPRVGVGRSFPSRMGPVHLDVAEAFEYQQAGRYADAAYCYDALLTHEPENAEALHLFGVMHHQCGHHARAIELIRRALVLRHDAPAYHANLAEAHRALGQHDEAAECCRAALRLQPHYPEAANNLGLALQGLGKHAEAADQFRAALDIKPGFAMAQNNLGILFRDQGNLDEAFKAFEAAVALDPDLGMARANLGQMLIDRGQAEQALEHLVQAARLQPDLAAAHNNLGNAYLALERWPEAQAAYVAALNRSPELVRAHANLGLALQRQGRLPAALTCFRKAVELAPEDADVVKLLADAALVDDDLAAALPCLERFAALRPELPEGHNFLGRAWQEQGRYEEAAACYRRVLELQPTYLDAFLNQGILHEELGAMSEAEAAFRHAHSRWPQAPGPLAHLATLLRGKLPDGDLEALQERLADPGLLEGPRGGLLFGLAQVLDARGEYALAAACLTQANALALELRRKEGSTYDPSEHALFVDRLIEGFTPDLFRRLAGAGSDTRQPIFVFGMPRSGTTVVEQVLASHSRVHGAGELRLVRQTFEGIPAVVGRQEGLLPCLNALTADTVGHLGERHLAAWHALQERTHPGPCPERLVDKMPDNYLYLGLIALLFPRATLIHVCRDARDVAVSCWMTNFRSIRWANAQDHLAGRIQQHRRLMAHWHTVLPVPVHVVMYERLVDNFETEARGLLSACGLDWEPACARFHETTRPVRTASVTQVRQPLYRKSLARWKHYEPVLADLFGQLQKNES
jgi:tetratricopeptide (TPR) repeat protein